MLTLSTLCNRSMMETLPAQPRPKGCNWSGGQGRDADAVIYPIEKHVQECPHELRPETMTI